MTRTQAERELRRRIEADVVLAKDQRRTIESAGAAYVEYLETVMERKPTTIADYRGYLRRHLVPHFAGTTIDKIDARAAEGYLRAKRKSGLLSKTVHNHLNFLHGLFRFSIEREWLRRLNGATNEARPPWRGQADTPVRVRTVAFTALSHAAGVSPWRT